MNTTGMSKQLPFLPGNSYADPTITRYHKTQLLGVRDGAMLGKIINISLKFLKRRLSTSRRKLTPH
jgi:hypothetical protein